MPSLEISGDARVVFLTGAGISVASGLRPFRGPGGIWNDIDVEAWATAGAMARDPVRCWNAHRELARAIAAAAPNPAHKAIADFERRRASGSTTVITQNVDALHQRAGSTRVIEVHGSLAQVRCTDPDCASPHVAAPDPAASIERPPACARCGRPLRYDVVLFEEMLPQDRVWAARDALRECELFIAVGTSGVVVPAAGYVREARYAGARTVFVNVEPLDPPNPYFQQVFIGRAEELLPELLGAAN